MPFSAAGALIVLLVIAMLGQASWSQHQRALCIIDDASSAALLTSAACIQNDLRHAARYATYRAIWEVSKQADAYGNDESRKQTLEWLATRYFMEQATKLENLYNQHDLRIELEVPSSSAWRLLDLKQAEDGYARAEAKLPIGTCVKISSWDNNFVLNLPCENFGTFIDSRYFLLQERMRAFIDGLGSVNTSWAIMEYISAWVGAWLKGEVDMNSSRSRAFFEIAWAAQEFWTFGSADYVAAAKGLADAAKGAGETNDGMLSELSDATLTVTPLRVAELERMRGYTDLALGALDEASAALGSVREQVKCAKEISEIIENFDNAGSALENIQRALEGAAFEVTRTRTCVLESSQRFNELVDFTAKAGEQNVVLAAVHEGLCTRPREDCPSSQEQVAWGVEGIDTKLIELQDAIAQAEGEENFGRLAESLKNLQELTDATVESLLAEPIPKRWVEFNSYAEPCSYEGAPPEPTKEVAPIYIDGPQDGTIGATVKVIEGVRSNIDKMEGLSERVEPSPIELEDVNIDEALRQKLELDNSELFGVDREQLYELLPPPPIQAQPGLSVFHEFSIKDVMYRREDPAGWFGLPGPTPIPLWFIGVTLWWAQWDVTLELEEGAVEEIFDFDNPTLPIAREVFGKGVIAHKPLAYRHGVPNEPFNFRLVIISLRPFSILSD